MKYHYEYRLIGETASHHWYDHVYPNYQSAHFDWAYYGGRRSHLRIIKFRVYE